MVLGDVYYVESENSDYYWNKLEWIDVGNRADLTDLATKAELNKMQTDLQYGTIIQEGQDLNEITEVGLYHSENRTITNSLTNCPIRDNGFRLEVITINIPNRLLQIIRVNAKDEIWIRRLNALIANENNGEWVKLVNNIDLFPQIYGTGNVIKSGENLNNFTKIGNYYSESASISATLQNCPISNTAFKLKVENIARTDRYIQTLIANNNEVKIYARVFDSSQTWGEWIEVTGQYLKKTGGTITGNLTIGNNANSWKQFCVERVINETRYRAALGAGSNGTEGATIAFQLANDEGILNRVDIRADGKMVNAITGKEYLQDEDTGWIDLPLTSAFKKTNLTNMDPVYRKVGKMVQVTGAVTPTAEIVASQITQIATLPTGFRPVANIYTLCQGSLMNKWLLFIETTGKVYIERYGVSSNEKIPTGTWLPFNATFFVG